MAVGLDLARRWKKDIKAGCVTRKRSLSINVTASLLKKRGVTIISCLIAKQDLLSGFVESSHWFDGAKQMLKVTSSFFEKDPGMEWSRIQHQLANGKLCIQINHSPLLEDVFDTFSIMKTVMVSLLI